MDSNEKSNRNEFKSEKEAKIEKNMDSLLKSDTHRFVEDFVNGFGDDNYPDVLLKELNKRLDNKGFKIDEKELKLHLIHVRKLKNEKREIY